MDDVTVFAEPPAPEGVSPYLPGAEPGREVRVVPHDPSWAATAQAEIDRIRAALGAVAVAVEHVGSTAVAGLPAKPLLDLDLLVADADDEAAYIGPLERIGFRHVIREPWWYGHRMLRGAAPAVNLHVFPEHAAEPVRHRLFRDWLREHEEDRNRYAAAKRAAADASVAAGEHVQQYNERKQDAVRAIYARIFASLR